MSIPVGPKEIREIQEYINKFIQWLKKEKWNRIKEKMSEARANRNLYSFLQWLYPSENIPLVNGLRYPVAVYPAAKTQWNDPESILIKTSWDLPESVDPNLKKAGESYRKLRQAAGAKMWNGHTYRMLKLETTNNLKMHCGLGWYFTAFETCDILELELLTKFAEKHPSNPSEFDSFFRNELKLRQLIHKYSLKEPQGRSAAIGISTLVLFRDRDHFKTILWERSGTVGPHGDLVHVLPSFMFQPVLDFDEEFSVKHNFYREYLEELFDVPEVKKLEGRKMSPFHFYTHPNLKFLRRLEEEKKARLLFTGVAVNLLNLRPEICTLLLIDTDEWYSKHSAGEPSQGLTVLTANEEFKPIEELLAEGKPVRVLLKLEKDLSFPRIDELSPSKMVPPGSAALIMGLEVARQIVN